MKIFIKGKGETSLDKSDFIAQGGEGSVYAKGKLAFKIYENPANMISPQKIAELSVLTMPEIIKPEDVILDSKNKAIGYTMRYVKNTYSLCQLFPRAFRERNNISPQMTFDLVKKLQDIVKHCHDKKILQVDGNEMNYLVDSSLKEILAIDTDSWQTPSFPATALMDSIRDRHCVNNHFNEGTDWFSFGILSFNMFIGLHPYKGKHPNIKTLDDRMLQNISVLNKNVSVPAACYDFSTIPKNYMEWYKAVFEEGKRLPPPFEGDIIQIVHKIKSIVGTNNFDIKELYQLQGNIKQYAQAFGIDIALTDNGFLINRKEVSCSFLKPVIGFTEKMGHAILAQADSNQIKLFNMNTGKEYAITCQVDDMASYQNRIYCKSSGKILELEFIEVGSNIIPGFKVIGTVMENASYLFQGCLIQNLMDNYYVSLFPKSKTCHQVKLPDLAGYRIIDAKFDNNVLMVMGMKGGKYDKFIMRFDEGYTTYDVRTKKDITHSGFNFIVLDSGICAYINEEENIELFSNKKDSTSLKVIDDPVIKGNMKLVKLSTGVGFYVDNKVYSIKSK